MGSTAISAGYGEQFAHLVVTGALRCMARDRRLLPVPVMDLLLAYTKWLSRQTDVTGPVTDDYRRTVHELAGSYAASLPWLKD